MKQHDDPILVERAELEIDLPSVSTPPPVLGHVVRVPRQRLQQRLGSDRDVWQRSFGREGARNCQNGRRHREPPEEVEARETLRRLRHALLVREAEEYEDVLVEYGVVALVLAHDVHLVGE